MGRRLVDLAKEQRKMIDKIPVSEKDLASFVEDALDTFGWLWIHIRPARVIRKGREIYETPYTGHKGFPDYVCVRENRLIFLELKSEKGSVSPEQADWLMSLWGTEAEVYLWHPFDSEPDGGKIVEILR